jgi:hypothetical protein
MAAVTGSLLAFAACTLILDRNSSQCQTDGDCAGFGTGLKCQSGACVAPAGVGGPPGCFAGTPQTEAQFLTHCGNASCLPFDSCSHNVCDAGAVALDGALLPVVKGDSGGGNTSQGPSIDPSTLPNCYDPSQGRGSMLYITGSSNFPPLLAHLAPLIVDGNGNPLTAVYRVTSSCDGVRSMLGSGQGDRLIHDPPPGPGAQYATYFNADGTSSPCLLGADGVEVDVGESDIFSSTCAGFGDPGESVVHVQGPIQAMAFVTPGISSQTAITAEAAFAVFGRGGKNGSNATVSPWDTPSYYFIRNANTGTQQMIGHAINVPADQFWGIDRGTAKSVASTLGLLDSPLAEKAIGIISVDYYDQNRTAIKALAFQAIGQTCGYLPDSTAFAMDKLNVRDGHYPIWGPLHFFAAATNGTPDKPAAVAFLTSVTGLTGNEMATDEVLNAYIDASLVPGCAMMVQRSSELGSLTPFAPRGQCGCYFQTRVTGKVPTECVTCTTSTSCADPARPFCSHGYCEPQ